MRENGFMEGNL